MTKRNSDNTNDNNSSKMRKSYGNKQLLEVQLVQHHHRSTPRCVLNIAQIAANQLQSEDLGKHQIESIARKFTIPLMQLSISMECW